MTGETKTNNARQKEFWIKILFSIAAVFSIFAVIAILLFLFVEGFPAIAKIGVGEFLFGTEWKPNTSDTFDGEIAGSYGILAMIVGSLYVTVGAVAVGGLLGFFTAVFLSKFCPKRLKGVLTQVINLLAGIPSVVYGFFGMQVFLPLIGNFAPNGSGAGPLAASIILGLMISPTIAALSKSAIDAVSDSYYEGARALGATHSQAIFGTVVPAAKSGIIASFILGIGRAIGETMAVIKISGNNTAFPNSPFSSFRTMTTNMVFEMGYAGELQRGALVGTGCVLVFFILVINLMFQLVRGSDGGGKKKKKERRLRNKPDKPPTAFTRFFVAVFRVSSTVFGKIGAFFAPINEGISFFFKRKRKWVNVLMTLLCFAMAGLAFVSLVVIIVFIMVNGLPNISIQLLFGEYAFGGAPTILPSIIATLILIAVTLVIAVPLGLCTAIFLAEYTKKGSKLVKLIRMAVEILSGIPSVVYGLFGMVLFCTLMNLDKSILAGSLTVTIMILPVIVRSTEESLKAISDSFREGSFALGAGKARTIFKVVLPSALPGILSAVILAIGRVVSESAPLMFTMGASMQAAPNSLLSRGTTLAVALYALMGEGLYVKQAYATACVLIILVFALNILSTLLVKGLQKRFTGAKAK